MPAPPVKVKQERNRSKRTGALNPCDTSPQGGIIEPTATGVPGKPVFGLLGQVSGGYGEKKFKPRFSGAADIEIYKDHREIDGP